MADDPVPPDEESALPDELGEQVGPYRILETLGEGGFGTVYAAEQTEPVRRRVALKVIKLGMDTKAVVARFEAERQALALMDHPNIAKVLGAGATSTGRPYFAMELVHGVPLTEYCDTHKLTTEQRLQLFGPICHAVQHAHQKGIIHRDLKPSNLLVTLVDNQPVPKIIDFGIAKATTASLTEKTVYTQQGEFIGTPAYMSPEQAERTGLDIDTRTDVYSLGAVLYELLTGAPPFEPDQLSAAGFGGVASFLRETDPLRPSQRLRTTSVMARSPSASGSATLLEEAARARSTEPPTLLRQLQGDLDWIVLKALEKDRTRRYETALGLALDLERFSNSEPVQARPASGAYRLSRFVRRNRAAVLAGAVLLLALVGGTTGSVIGYVRAKAAEEDARNSEATARKAEALATERQRAAEEAETRATEGRLRAERAETEAVALRQLAEGRLTETERARADESVQRARAEHEALRAGALSRFLIDTLSLADASVALDTDLSMRSFLDGVSSRVDAALANQPRAEAQVRTVLGKAYVSLGELVPAEQNLRRALEILDTTEATPAELYEVLLPLAELAHVVGHVDAPQFSTRMLETAARALAPQRPVLATHVEQLRKALDAWDEPAIAHAAANLREAARSDVPAGHTIHLQVAAIHLMASQLLAKGRRDLRLVEQLLRDALQITRSELPRGSPFAARIQLRLAGALRRQGSSAEAETLVREIVDEGREVLGPESLVVVDAEVRLASMLVSREDWAAAEELLLHANQALEQSSLRDGALRVRALMLLTMVYDGTGSEQADAIREQLRHAAVGATRLPRGVALAPTVFGREHLALAEAYLDLRRAIGDTVSPPVPLREAVDLYLIHLEGSLEPTDLLAAVLARVLSEVAQDRPGLNLEHPALFERGVLPAARAWASSMPGTLAEALANLAQGALFSSDFPRAEALWREAYELGQATDADSWKTAIARRELGNVVRLLGRRAEAAEHLEAAYTQLRQQLGWNNPEARVAWRHLFHLYKEWDQPERFLPHLAQHVRDRGRLLDDEVGPVFGALAPRTARVFGELLEGYERPGFDPVPTVEALVATRRDEMADDSPLALVWSTVSDFLVETRQNSGLNFDAGGPILFADFRRVVEAQLDPLHGQVVALRVYQIDALLGLDRFDEAESEARALLELLEPRLGPDDHEVGLVVAMRGRALSALGRHDEAELLLRRALPVITRRRPVLGEIVLDTLDGVAGHALDKGRPRLAEELLLPVLQQAAADGEDSERWQVAFTVCQRPGLPRSIYQAALDAVPTPPRRGIMGTTWLARGAALTRLGRAREAAEHLAECDRQWENPGFRALALTALCLIDLGELERAREVLGGYHGQMTRRKLGHMLEVRNFAAEIEAALAAAEAEG